jgi:drug/metabolite transporter superfamily protein YnfA
MSAMTFGTFHRRCAPGELAIILSHFEEVKSEIHLLIYQRLVATLQPATFGRAYAAYGGIFIILSILWGWRIDSVVPDRLDWVGASIILVGVLVMMYAPRA